MKPMEKTKQSIWYTKKQNAGYSSKCLLKVNFMHLNMVNCTNMVVTFIMAKVIQLFGFVLYPEMDFSDCVPNKLNREAGFLFLAFLEHMFKKCKTFQLSAGVSMFPFLTNVMK